MQILLMHQHLGMHQCTENTRKAPRGFFFCYGNRFWHGNLLEALPEPFLAIERPKRFCACIIGSFVRLTPFSTLLDS